MRLSLEVQRRHPGTPIGAGFQQEMDARRGVGSRILCSRSSSTKLIYTLGGEPSPKAEAAHDAFRCACANLPRLLRLSVSGREVVDRGFPSDVDLAAGHDASIAAPWLVDDAFQGMPDVIQRPPPFRLPGNAQCEIGSGYPSRSYPTRTCDRLSGKHESGVDGQDDK